MRTTFYQLTLISGLCLTFTNAIAQWTKVSSDGANDLIVHNNALYASGAKVFKTTDGNTWTESSTGVSGGGSPNCIRSYGGTLYVGGNGSSYYTSTDDGASWNLKSGRSGLATVKTTGIYVDGNDMTYGTTGGGKWQYSTNGGSSWSGSDITWGVTPGNIGPDFVKIGTTLYSNGYDYVFKSTDNGKNWDTTTRFGVTSSLCAQGNALFCAGYGSGVNKSSDGGASWKCVMGCDITNPARSASRIISNGNSLFVVGALGKVNQSTDGGETWTDLSGDGTVLASSEIITAVAVFNNELFVATSTGIYKRSISSGNTAIQELSSLIVSLFPNPAKEGIEITLPSSKRTTEILVFTIQGKLQLQQFFQNQQHIQLNLDAFDKGLYFVTIVADGVSTIKPLVID